MIDYPDVECFMVELAPDAGAIYTLDDDDRTVVGPTHEEPENWKVKSPLYRRVDNGEVIPTRPLPPGAMYDALAINDLDEDSYYHRRAVNGQALYVILPNGHAWFIDGRASNCTRPDDDEHRCWVRVGEPPKLTVNKEGDTCDAGGGSILTAAGSDQEWHGFLRDGRLVR